MDEIKNDLKVRFALDAMQRGVLLTRRVYEKYAGDKLTKEDRSPVTLADFGVQAILGHVMNDFFPNDALVAEESTDMLREESNREALNQVTELVQEIFPELDETGVLNAIDRGNAEPGDSFWTLDPVDGTKGFVSGGQYAIALACIENGEVVFGALACPNLKSFVSGDDTQGAMIVALKGQGSWAVSNNLETFERLQVSKYDALKDFRILSSLQKAHSQQDALEDLKKSVGIMAEPIRLDSQSKHALLASGQGELFFRIPPKESYREKIWDAAAGMIAITEAGGKVTDLDGKALDFTKGNALFENRGIFASNNTRHEDVLAALKKVPI